MPYPRPTSGLACALTTRVTETCWALPGLEMAAKDKRGEVPYCGVGAALAAACAARKRATSVSSRPSGTRAQAIPPLPSFIFVLVC